MQTNSKMICDLLYSFNCLLVDIDQFSLINDITIYVTDAIQHKYVKEFYSMCNLVDVEIPVCLVNSNIKNLQKIERLHIFSTRDTRDGCYDITKYCSILLELLKLPNLCSLLFGYFHKSGYEYVKSLLSNIMLRSKNIVSHIFKSSFDPSYYYISYNF